MAFARAIVGAAKKSSRRRNIARSEHKMTKTGSKKITQTDDHIISGLDDSNYKSLSMDRDIIGLGDEEIGEEIGRIREQIEFHRKYPGTKPIEASTSKFDPKSSKVTSKETPSIDSLMFRKSHNASKGEAHMYDATNKQLVADLNAMNDPLARKDISVAYGIKDHENMTTTQFRDAIRGRHLQRINAGPKVMDHMMGHKVPQKALGTLITAGVVSSLFGSKGQQSNAQLYGQAPMPGM